MDTPAKRYFSTTVGMKILVAVSGVAMVGFVIAHLAGNLQIFLGAEAINRYAAFLQASSEFLWPMRIFLILMLVVHIVAQIKLTQIGCAVRPVPYADKQYIKATLASRTMIWTGTMILGFIIYHL